MLNIIHPLVRKLYHAPVGQSTVTSRLTT